MASSIGWMTDRAVRAASRLATAVSAGLVLLVPAAHGGHVITTVDSSPGAVGEYTSLRMNASGNPVVSYHYFTNDDLKLATCTANCQGATPTWQIVTVDSTGRMGLFTSLQMNASGNPVVSYFDNSNFDLKLATCTAGCQGATPTWQIVTVDSAGNVGQHTSLRMNASGNPVVSYHDHPNSNGDLKLATCTADCQGATPTWQIVTVDSAGDVGRHTSLSMNASGNPVVSYYDITNFDLKLATCTAGCQGATPTWQILTVDSAGNVGEYTSLSMNANGNPVVSYWDATNSALKLATCTAGCQGATPTWQIVTVDNAGFVGQHTSLQMNASGNPVVSYYDGTNGDLKLAICTAGCQGATPTWRIVTVDNSGDVGRHSSLQMNASGDPVVSYYDGGGNNDLKLAIVDLVPPAVASIVRVQPSPTNAASVDFTVTFTESVTGVDVVDFTLATTGVTGASVTGVAGSGTTYIVTVATGAGSGTIRLDVADNDTITDGANALGGTGAGNGNFTTGEVYTIDRAGPTVTSVGVPANANYVTGQNVDFTVNWDEAATVTGTPVLPITIGAATVNAAYLSGSGTTALAFRYTVVAADNDNDGIAVGAALALSGGTLRDALSNDATLTLNGVGATTGVFVNRTFIVTPSAGANGMIAPNTPQTIAQGATTAFTVAPNAGYTAAVGGTCGGSLVGTTYTTNAITANCTVSATFTQITYTVTPSAGANGTIAPNTPQTVSHGATTLFTVTPSAGYTAVVGGTCGGSLVGTTYTTNAVTANCTVSATFTQITYTVTPSAGANGTIAPNTPQTVSHGATTLFTVTPSAGYTAVVGGTCGGSLVGTTYTTNAVTANCTVSATFTQITYTVTPSAGANGTIAPNTPQTVGHGATSLFTVTPSAGYTAVVGGTCGGSLVGTMYTTNAITANCTVSATFTQITYTVTPSAGANGTIAPNTPRVIAQGATSTFTVTPNTGYTAVVGGTCTGSLVGTTYTTNAITANCTVSATFTFVPVTSHTGPTATGSGNATVTFTGGGATCSFAPQGNGPAQSAFFIALTGHPKSPPAGSAPSDVAFPHGLLDFVLVNCTPGATVSFTITYPRALPPGTLYWKYGPTPSNATPSWYVLPATISGNIATFSITDGGLGDDDLAANGTVVDQGGPGVPPGTGAIPTPTLSEWAMLLLALLIFAAAMRGGRLTGQTARTRR